MRKSLVIFDLDGTLIDSVPDLALATDQTLEQLEAPKAGIKHVRNWVGDGSLKLIERAITWAGLPNNVLPYAHTLFLQHYTACHDGTVAYDGVTDGLNCLLATGFVLGLCTNKPTLFIPNILSKMGWTDKFACVVGGDTLSTKKPSPEPLWHICTTLNINTAQAVMVGDSMNDIKAGKNAGIDTLALSYGYNYGLPITDSLVDNRIFDNFGALVEFLCLDAWR